MQHVVIINRGLPGSGKSTWSAQQNREAGALVLSTDEFWGPTYNFDSARIGEAHDWNKVRFVDALVQRRPYIIVDNTNLSVWEPKFYIETAKIFGYHVEEKLFFGDYGSTKSIAKETLQKMRAVWQATLREKGIELPSQTT